ncbi:zinc-dependent metalloprotease [Blastopirellula sp. JC732]|uniref:Zinc-dependent metalloprotease n=1 Tax=Blastopirellula sediminis TaxID=2894196 RepID=A0A9X1SIK1_9BACT|nr:zinc-dependent metalloprotease [Blastopirellula sediminis]MCC9609099.1 zinc-dependent metalloprotease [Blastopirellula sediminis]MCC9628124.1 zinc-dependent metalloprotease [Blastopirellula sediminis]
MKLSTLLRSTLAVLVAAGLTSVICPPSAFADDAETTKEAPAETAKANDNADKVMATTGGSSDGGGGGGSSESMPEHARILKDFKKVDGLIPMYHKGNRLFLELSPQHYSGEYIVLISISRGIGQYPIYGGFSWGFGDDWVWKFRKIDDNVHIIRKNVRFKADSSKPEAKAVQHAYSDSVLFSLPADKKGPNGGDLIEVTPVFMSDLPMISDALPGSSFSPSKSVFSEVKGFSKNIELEVAATYSTSGRMNLDTVPDSRGVSIDIHYSISKIPSTGYQPRLADDRVGYFLTVVKNFSQSKDDQFVRYINRWDLKKAEPGEKMSEPAEPILFHLENTVPYKYRKPIRDGILEWNKAFEKAGYIDAVRVRQQEDDDTWDPEDVNYNTFRWITSDAGFAMGPSRTNPYNGQILDADIIFDASFLNSWQQTFEDINPQGIAALTGGWPERQAEIDKLTGNTTGSRMPHSACMLGRGMTSQMAFANLIAAEGAAAVEDREAVREKLFMQGLKEVTMHEVGHTLGLRHNFKASKFRTLEEMNDTKITADGMVSSVMDYVPANISPKGEQQGDYFPQTLGPYDIWAIQYGYTPYSGGTEGEKKELDKLASRSGEAGLTFATDEDTTSSAPDPDSNRFDFGDDAVKFAERQAKVVHEAMDDLVNRVVKEGDDYSKARRAFNVLLSTHGQAMFFVSRYVGGIHISRSHKGDKDAQPPMKGVDVEQQRAALKLLEEQVFSDKPYEVDPSIYNQLAPSHWDHWGSSPSTRPDFPIHSYIEMWQDRVLSQLLSSGTLTRMHDSELKVGEDEEAMTTAELIDRLTKVVYSELDGIKKGDAEFTNSDPAISSLRRGLQRNYLRRLSNIALGDTYAPDDCQTIAYAQLTDLSKKIDATLKKKVKLDPYSQAHLVETKARIDKVLDSQLIFASP